jgi:hypothetical protein
LEEYILVIDTYLQVHQYKRNKLSIVCMEQETHDTSRIKDLFDIMTMRTVSVKPF